MSDPLTTPVGAWAPAYAERLHHVEPLLAIDWHNPVPAAVETLQAWDAPFGEPEPTTAIAEDIAIGGPHGPIPLRIYRPAKGEPSGVGMVWFHGGGFIGGTLDMPEADLVARGLVTRTGGVVVSVDYRLCKDGVHHPIPHDDGYAAYRWTRDHADQLGIDVDRLAVGGASAGGCQASTISLHARDEGISPSVAVLIYPVAHGVMPEPSAELGAILAELPIVLRSPPEVSSALNWNYIGSEPANADPYAFAGHSSDLTGYPRTYIENGEFDDLRASGERFGQQLADAGADVTVVTAAGLPHGYLNAVGSPLTYASLDRISAVLFVTAEEPSRPSSDGGA